MGAGVQERLSEALAELRVPQRLAALGVPQQLLDLLNGAANQIKPLLATGWDAAASAAAPLVERTAPLLSRGAEQADAFLAPLRPWQAAALGATTSLLLLLLLLRLLSAWRHIQASGGVRRSFFTALRSAPFVRSFVDKEMAKVRAKVAEGLRKHSDGSPPLTQLPAHSSTPEKVLALLRAREAQNVRIPSGKSSISGAVYIANDSHKAMLDEAHALFSWTNPLHADVFPSVRQMEAEVVAMTAAMLDGGPGRAAPLACGCMTSGGTESILLAVKAARDFARVHRGVTNPNMVLGRSAHAAYIKAAEYFNISIIKAPLGRDHKLHGDAVRRRITRDTVIVVASAPGFPHGVIDDVTGIASAAKERNIPCHVDCCLGGFVLPFARQLGYPIPPFDFAVPGVTSISVDTHKFGMAQKGTSVILYRDPAMRRFQFTSITDWSGGLYISPSMAGSRSGAVIASAWASLVALGEQGLLAATAAIMEASRAFQAKLLSEVPQLVLVGRPDMCVVAFAAKQPRKLNVYQLNDALTARGWHLNALQFPPALHFCFTAQHVGAVDALVADIKYCVSTLLSTPAAKGSKEGTAPLYGMAGVSPDRGLIGDFLVAFQDVMLEP